MNPKELIKKWVETFNNADADSLSEFYSEDAVNHQIAESAIEGKGAIKKMFEQEFAQAEMVCIIENIFEDGEWVILEWKDPLGLMGCGFFHIKNNKIIFQRGYWDKLSYLRMHNLPIPNR
ncbi:MAG: nuclear transport factor 2 family protein [bacterium]|nr:nuclear transport factor 2 family protein [bacterium]